MSTHHKQTIETPDDLRDLLEEAATEQGDREPPNFASRCEVGE